MYTYLFERAAVGGGPGGYQAATARLAAEGWRLVQILVEIPAAVPSEHVLVLERPVGEPLPIAGPPSPG